MEVYFRQAMNTEAERRAVEIRLRAERKAGGILAIMEKAKGAQGTGINQYSQVRSPDVTAPTIDDPDEPELPMFDDPAITSQNQPTLRDLGVTYRQSSDWQRMAAIPEDDAAAYQTIRKTSGFLAAAPGRPIAPTIRQKTRCGNQRKIAGWALSFLTVLRRVKQLENPRNSAETLGVCVIMPLPAAV